MNQPLCTLLAATGMFLVLSSQAAPAEVDTEAPSTLSSYVDCQDSCRDCQKACQQNVPAGSKQSDCIRACTASAAGCCGANGKNPPSGLTCTCS
jgi:hypothetical protein